MPPPLDELVRSLLELSPPTPAPQITLHLKRPSQERAPEGHSPKDFGPLPWGRMWRSTRLPAWTRPICGSLGSALHAEMGAPGSDLEPPAPMFARTPISRISDPWVGTSRHRRPHHPPPRPTPRLDPLRQSEIRSGPRSRLRGGPRSTSSSCTHAVSALAARPDITTHRSLRVVANKPRQERPPLETNPLLPAFLTTPSVAEKSDDPGPDPLPGSPHQTAQLWPRRGIFVSSKPLLGRIRRKLQLHVVNPIIEVPVALGGKPRGPVLFSPMRGVVKGAVRRPSKEGSSR